MSSYSLSGTESLSGNFEVNIPLSANPPLPVYFNLIEPLSSSFPYPKPGIGDSWNVPVAENPHPDATYNYTLYCTNPAAAGHFEIYWNQWSAGHSGGLIGPTDSQVFTAYGQEFYWGDYQQQQPRLGVTPGDFVIFRKTTYDRGELRMRGNGFMPAIRVMIGFSGTAVTQAITGVALEGNSRPITGKTLRMRHLGYY